MGFFQLNAAAAAG